MSEKELILQLLTKGLARIEKSATENFAEFCFQGIRYPCTDCDWKDLVSCIGRKKLRAALTKGVDNDSD